MPLCIRFVLVVQLLMYCVGWWMRALVGTQLEEGCRWAAGGTVNAAAACGTHMMTTTICTGMVFMARLQFLAIMSHHEAAVPGVLSLKLITHAIGWLATADQWQHTHKQNRWRGSCNRWLAQVIEAKSTCLKKMSTIAQLTARAKEHC